MAVTLERHYKTILICSKVTVNIMVMFMYLTYNQQPILCQNEFATSHKTQKISSIFLTGKPLHMYGTGHTQRDAMSTTSGKEVVKIHN